MRVRGFVTKTGKEIEIGKFTVLVGPNNVGKSQTLRDIQAKMVDGNNARATIIDRIKLEKDGSFDDVLRGLDVEEHKQNIGQHRVRGIVSNLRAGDEVLVDLQALRRQYEDNEDPSHLLAPLGRFRVSFLDAASRLFVAQATGSHNPQANPPQNLLQALYGTGADVEARLQKIFKDTFAMDIKLDYSGLLDLRLRVAPKFEEVPEDPRKAYPILVKYHALDDQGDGFRSFVGVVLSLLLSEGRVILLDEPEAFLHPAQARRLGRWIATHAESVPGQIIVSTHNANFLAGILSESQNVDIFRVNRKDDDTSYNRIPSETTAKLATSPVMSSQRILEAIFYKGVVVCEADADRSIYQMVAVKEWRNENVLFVHAHNKQTIKDVVSVLKDATIPVCAITDIDILNSHTELKKLVEALDVERDSSESLTMRKEIAEAIDKRTENEALDQVLSKLSELVKELQEKQHTLSGARGALNRLRSETSNWAHVKERGLEGIPDKHRALAEKLIDRLRVLGLFVVLVGELEGWIELGTRKKNKWIVLALEAIDRGECPQGLREFIGTVLSFMGEDVSPVPGEDGKAAAQP